MPANLKKQAKVHMMSRRVLYLLMLFAAVSSCKPKCKTKDTDLLGKYYLKELNGALHYVELKADRSYLHKFDFQDKNLSQSGEWRIYKDCQIIFRNWKFLD